MFDGLYFALVSDLLDTLTADLFIIFGKFVRLFYLPAFSKVLPVAWSSRPSVVANFEFLLSRLFFEAYRF